MPAYRIWVLFLVSVLCSCATSSLDQRETGQTPLRNAEAEVRKAPQRLTGTQRIKEAYYPTGELQCRFAVSDGVPNGPFKRYWKTGVVIEEGNYIGFDDRNYCLDGPFKRWHPSGQQWQASSYTNCKLEGAFKIVE